MNRYSYTEWWKRNKKMVYGTLLVVSGLFGGNIDRIICCVIPSACISATHDEKQRISNLERYIISHEQSHKGLRKEIDTLTINIDSLKEKKWTP